MHTFSTEPTALEKKQTFGRVDFQIVQHRILHFVATGPFDIGLIEAIQQVVPYLKKAVRLTHKNWADIIEFRGSCEASDAFLDSLKQHLIHEVSQHRAPLAIAFIIPAGLDNADTMAKKYIHCYEAAGIPCRRINNPFAAFKWVNTVLDQAS